MTRVALACALSAAVLCAAITLAAVPLTGDIPVNQTITGAQADPAVAMDADGDFVVVWQADDPEGADDVLVRRFGANGSPLSDELPVKTGSAGDQSDPNIAVAPNGDGVVVYDENESDGSTEDVYARLFSGSPFGLSGAEKEVATTPDADEDGAVAAMDGEGNFVVAWENPGVGGDTDDIFARRFDANGDPRDTPPITVASGSADQDEASVGMDADGDFVVAWASDAGIFAKRFNAAGAVQGDEFPVNTQGTGFDRPSVTLDADGDFVIAWQGSAEEDIFARRFNAAGAAQGDEFPVNTTLDGEQERAWAASDADGDFVIGWTSETIDGTDVFAREFDADGTPFGDDFTVNDTLPGVQEQPGVASDEDGDLVIAWQGEGDGDDVFARRFAPGVQPSAPTLTDSDPDSPANDNSPRIKGSAEAGSTVRLYTTPTCSGSPAATGSAAQFASPGLQVSVGDDTTTTFYATATDQAGVPSPCSTSSLTYVEVSTTPDQTRPVAAIVSAPSGTVSDRTPTFTFTADEAGVGFECSIDGGPFAPCTSPFTAPALPGGRHTFAVRARDAAGNLGPVTTVDFTVAQTLDELTQTDPPTLARDVNVAPVGDGPSWWARGRAPRGPAPAQRSRTS